MQGVGFRYFVLSKAQEFGLTGWVRNEANGDVEAYAVGLAEALDDLAAALYIGPRMAEVCTVEQREADVQQLSSFRVE